MASNHLLRNIWGMLIAVFLFSSCGIYSFRNGTIPAEVKTVNIKLY